MSEQNKTHDAELPEGLQSHIDIGAALHRRDQADPAVPLQQGKGKEQAADELAADVTRQHILSRRQSSADQKILLSFFKCKALFPADVLIDLEGPGQQRRAAGQPALPPAEQTDGDQETDGAAALPAGEDGTSLRARAV